MRFCMGVTGTSGFASREIDPLLGRPILAQPFLKPVDESLFPRRSELEHLAGGSRSTG